MLRHLVKGKCIKTLIIYQQDLQPKHCTKYRPDLAVCFKNVECPLAACTTTPVYITHRKQ